MKCLVTGSSGFIGQHLVKALEERGDEVMKVSHFDLRIAMAKAIEDKIGKRFGPDYIFHLSAYGNMAIHKDIEEIFFTNSGNTFRLLQGLVNIPYKAFINISSSSVMLPHQTMYSATKMGAEYLCKAFVDEYDKPIVSFRPYSVYGPGEAPFRFIPTVFRSCLKGEEFTLAPDAVHDWIYVDNVVDNMLDLAERANVEKGNVALCGTGIATTNIEIVKMVEKITKKKAKYKLANKPLRAFDNQNWVSNRPIYKPILLEEGLRNYYESIK